MWECANAKEPVNVRLFLLKTLRKIWIVPVSMVVCAALVLGIRCFDKYVIEGRVWQINNYCYMSYAGLPQDYSQWWINQYTWGEISNSGVIIDRTYELLDGSVSKDDLRNYTDANIESDARYISVITATHDKALTEKISAAYTQAVVEYGMKVDFAGGMEVITYGDLSDGTKLRALQAVELGLILGFAIPVVIILLVELLDMSVYIPETLERRYNLICLGTPSMKELKENADYRLKGFGKLALVKLDKNADVSGDLLNGHECEIFENPVVSDESCENIRKCEGVVLAVPAGKGNAELIERTLMQFSRQDIKVVASVLVNEDIKMINSYYRLK